MANKVIPTNMPHPMSAVGWDGMDFHILTIDAAGHLQVDNLSSALPTGAATAANQLTEIAALQLIDDLRAALHSVNTDELQVNVEDSVLPAGASTEVTLAALKTKVDALLLYDRGLGKVVSGALSNYAAHALTSRYSYTVPAGHHALLEGVSLYIGLPDAGKQGIFWVTVGGTLLILVMVENGNTLSSTRIINWSGAIWLPTGTGVSVLTASTALVNVDFWWSVVISEFHS